MEHEFDLMKSPFSCDFETGANELQVELINLQADNALKSSFKKCHWLSFINRFTQKNSQEICKKNVCDVCIYIQMRANILKYKD